MGVKSSRARSRKNESEELESESSSQLSSSATDRESTDERRVEGSSPALANARGSGAPIQRSATAKRIPAQHRSGGSERGYVAHDPGPDREPLSQRYGLDVREGQARTLQRLETEFGRTRVSRWTAEGMSVETMGKPRDMRAFRKRQADRPAEVPTDVERRNEASVQRNAARNREPGPAGETVVPDAVRAVVSSPGRSMDGTVQREMETKVGGDFDDVRVHTGPRAAAAAEAIGARAFTVGNHVAFNRGEYRPGSAEGTRVLAHELTHVRQQTQGEVSMLPKAEGTIAIDPDPELEREAEETARRVTDERRTVRRMGTEMHVQPRPEERLHGTRAERAGARATPVQFSGATRGENGYVRAAAAEGVRGSGGELPYLNRLQSSFPNHDLSNVRAHTDRRARKANEKIGSEAYTTGSHVAFRDSPDLETAAHEVTHVIQQRDGVHLRGGVGAAGDRYEREADRVASRVVRGEDPAVGDIGGSSAPIEGDYVQMQESDQAPAGIDPEEDKVLVNLPVLEEGVTIDLPGKGPTTFTGLDALMAALQVYPGTSLQVAPFNAARVMALATGTTNALGVSADASKGVEGAAAFGVAFGPNGEIATYGSLGGGVGIGLGEFFAVGASATLDYTFVWGGLAEFSGPCYVIEFGFQAGYGAELSFIVGTAGDTWTPEALSGASVGAGIGIEAGVAARAEHTWTQLVVDQARGQAQEEEEQVLDEESGDVVQPEEVEEDSEPTSEEPAEPEGQVEMGTPLWQYQVEPGDTLAGIADAYDVSGGWQRLYYDIEANRRTIGSDPSMIHPGDTVWIPMD